MSTYRDLISASLRLIGVTGQGQSVKGPEAHDALETLRELIDSWNSSDVMLYRTEIVEHQLESGKQEYTIGPDADIVVNSRPTQLDAAFLRYADTENQMTIISSREYGRIADKDIASTNPYYIYYDTAFPVGNLSLYPIPSGSSRLILHFLTTMDINITLDTELVLPPAYRGAIRYNLAVMLAPEYGVEPSQSVVSQSISSVARVQASNFKPARMDFDLDSYGSYDIDTDSNR